MLTLIILAALAIHPGTQDGGPDGIAIQVALVRAGFSPGVVDGQLGPSTRLAMEAHRRARGSDPEPVPDPILTYTIGPGDVSGPFAERIPDDLVAQAKLPALDYTSPVEALAERFHTTPELLQRLNPGATFAAGEQIRVPNVNPFIVPAPRLVPGSPQPRPAGRSEGTAAESAKAVEEPDKPDVIVTVSESSGALTVTDTEDRVLFHAPVTTGSRNDPLPIGEWKVNGIQYSPDFHYNPDLFWDADPSHAKAKIPAGPNNPVGVVWIDLSKDHYGIHGTPEPSLIGRTASHGCVRLTNWDALKLAGMVKPGTRVVFTK